MVLMRLFQTSRRFNVEIQPQLVLLQKTLLNIEGLGRQLDPELDLWSTARPFLERWMLEQVGPQKLWAELKSQAPRYAKLLPDLPWLVHEFLRKGARRNDDRQVQELLVELRRTNRRLRSMAYVALAGVIAVAALHLMVELRLF